MVQALCVFHNFQYVWIFHAKEGGVEIFLKKVELL